MSPFYLKPHQPSQSQTSNAVLPPGYIGNPDTESRAQFIKEQKDRKYKHWDVATDNPEFEEGEGTRKVKDKRTGYIIDDTENY